MPITLEPGDARSTSSLTGSHGRPSRHRELAGRAVAIAWFFVAFAASHGVDLVVKLTA